jgi:hypothetical protein
MWIEMGRRIVLSLATLAAVALAIAGVGSVLPR